VKKKKDQKQLTLLLIIDMFMYSLYAFKFNFPQFREGHMPQNLYRVPNLRFRPTVVLRQLIFVTLLKVPHT